MPHPRSWIVLTLIAAFLLACSTHTPMTPDMTTSTSTTSAPSNTNQRPATSDQSQPTSHQSPVTSNQIALTFDAGSDAGHTAEILDVLRRENVRATFGITGLWAEQNHDLLLAIAADGHQIINHTDDHKSFTGASTNTPPLTAEQRALELSRTEVTVYHLSGHSTRPYWRPPYGDVDESARRDAAAAGYTITVMWDVDTLGWNHATADAIVERSLANAAPGAIYVMHVGSESQDAAALPRIIAGLSARGYTFGAIEDVLPR